MKKSLNEMTVTLKIERIKVTDLMIACTAAMASCREMGADGSKWYKLHAELKAQLDAFDKKQGY